MKPYPVEKSEKEILHKIKEALDNLEGLNLSNVLKAEAILSNIKNVCNFEQHLKARDLND